jgi:hypothetical protein
MAIGFSISSCPASRMIAGCRGGHRGRGPAERLGYNLLIILELSHAGGGMGMQHFVAKFECTHSRG